MSEQKISQCEHANASAVPSRFIGELETFSINTVWYCLVFHRCPDCGKEWLTKVIQEVTE